MIPLSNKIARKPQPITKKERLKGAALWGVQALVVPSIHPSIIMLVSKNIADIKIAQKRVLIGEKCFYPCPLLRHRWARPRRTCRPATRPYSSE